MKARLFFLVLTMGIAAQAGDVAGYKTVYLLPMSGGLDQFLATRLTSGVVMQVVTDPLKADVVLTDRIGAAFEEHLNEIYGEKRKPDPKDSLTASPQPIDIAISHGRGLIFMVDRRTREVVWSTFIKPKDASPDAMNRVALEIAAKLDRDRKGKPEGKPDGK
jgi:hypothetical protein